MDQQICKVKTCRQCRAEKPITEFYRNPQGKDGYRNFCKVCTGVKYQNYYKDRRWKARKLCLARGKQVPNVMPPWLTEADIEAMIDVYEEAIRLTAETGIHYWVDHIIPLGYPSVTGLHVPANLQVLTASENSRKRYSDYARYGTSIN